MSTEIWQATELESVFDKSRTKPLVVWCEHETGDEPPKRFVVKAPGHPEVLESNLFAELFGNLLAREFGIPTPQPALVIFTTPFVKSVQRHLPPEIQLRVGFGVGAEYMPPLNPLLSNYRLPLSLRPQATMIYAFDLLVANFDRRIGNANCALRNNELLAYDFECSFSFLQALFGPRPWEVAKLGIAQHHIFQRELAASGTDWAPFMDVFRLLDERRLGELVKDFPISWLVHSQRVFDYLLEAQSHDKGLSVQLELSLRV